MAKRFFIDIETLPPGEDARPRFEDLIRRELSEQGLTVDDGEFVAMVEERFRSLALRPEYGRVLTIGLIVEDESGLIHQGVLGRDRDTGRLHTDEARTLRSFWKLLRGFDPYRDVLVGHNVLDFDLQFLCKRSVVCQVKPSFDVCFARYRQRPVFDTMWEWGHWRKCISLHELADALGVESPKEGGLDGSMIYDAYVDGRHNEIALYCMRDVECTREVYYRLNYLEPPPLEKYAAKAAAGPSQNITGVTAGYAQYDLSVS
jgi:hypothetical protein